MTGQGYHKAACPPYCRGEERLPKTPENLRVDKLKLTRKPYYGGNKVMLVQNIPHLNSIVCNRVAKQEPIAVMYLHCRFIWIWRRSQPEVSVFKIILTPRIC